MSDTTTLLRQLTLARPSPDPAPPRGRRIGAVTLAGAVALLFAAASGALWYFDSASPAALDPAASALPATLPATTGTSAAGTLENAALDTAGDPAPAATALAPESVLNASGYVVARRQATVSARTTSRVSEVLVEEGMQVTQGQILARLDDRNERAELALAEAEAAAVQAQRAELEVLLGNALQELSRTRALAAERLASSSLVDLRATEAEALRARIERNAREVVVAARRVSLQQSQLADLVVRAPFAGVVIEKSVQPGEVISPVSAGGGFTRTGIATLVDMASLEVEVDVNEAYINRVTPGQPVAITLNAYPEAPYPGRVLAVIPTADRGTATIRVRIGFTEPDRRVLPEMGIRAAFLVHSEAPPPE